MVDVNQMFNIVDAMGKTCPMPLLMLKRALKNSNGLQILLKSSDPHSQQDIMRYCQINQLKCDIKCISNHEFHYIIAE